MHLSPVGKVSVSARSTERLPEHATCQIAGTRNGDGSGGAPVGEDFPRTRIREEKARYGGVLERSGASRRNRWAPGALDTQAPVVVSSRNRLARRLIRGDSRTLHK